MTFGQAVFALDVAVLRFRKSSPCHQYMSLAMLIVIVVAARRWQRNGMMRWLQKLVVARSCAILMVIGFHLTPGPLQRQSGSWSARTPRNHGIGVSWQLQGVEAAKRRAAPSGTGVLPHSTGTTNDLSQLSGHVLQATHGVEYSAHQFILQFCASCKVGQACLYSS
mmetsp:Transcript_60360/g.112784  ORF Transcript_60360/g.112784 Transcript_60360/m.112784 type:complete len:166 (+) Transcript_60360:489-986(+)